MSIDSRYITSVSLSPYLVNKSTGYPLSNGTIEFYKDDDRAVPKLVYQISGAPPNYTYTALPNPLTLSAVGTIQNAGGDNIALYYFPYESFDVDAAIELYYIVVKDEGGVVQFTREAWPNIDSSNSPGGSGNGDFENEIINPQFVSVLFSPPATLSIPYSGLGITTFDIAANWTLVISHSGAGTVTVSRNSISGSLNYPTNPPYTLVITAGANITNLRLRQRFLHNPGIWSLTSSGVGGFFAGSILLAPGSAATMYYTPSIGTEQQIFSANNASGAWSEFGDTVQLILSDNTADSDTGYIDINLEFPVLGAVQFSSVQVVPLESNITLVPYDQDSVLEQLNEIDNGNTPSASNNLMNSYLIGWDFPFNPSQFNGGMGNFGPVASGANTSSYFWDQTIVFQSANSGVSSSRNVGTSDGSLILTAAATTQIALIQYLDGPTVFSILAQSLSVNVRCMTDQVGGVTATVSLWYTLGAIPNVASGTNQSLVATLDATGKPATFHGTWVEIPRGSFGNAEFTIAQGTIPSDYGFSGWLDTTGAILADARYFAIVIGTASVTQNNTITFNSISLVPGNVATRPAILSTTQHLLNCQRYYWTTLFPIGGGPPLPASGQIANTIAYRCQIASTTAGYLAPLSCPVQMREGANFTFYNPISNNNKWYNTTGGADSGTPAVYPPPAFPEFTGVVGFENPQVAGDSPGNTICVHVSADSRLGII